MNKLIKVTEYFVTQARQQKAEVAEVIVDKLDAGNEGTEFQALMQHRRQLKVAIEGLEQLQWQLGKTRIVKPAGHRVALRHATTLRKELSELARCAGDDDREAYRAFDLAWQFVVSQSTGTTEGLSIFDDDLEAVAAN